MIVDEMMLAVRSCGDQVVRNAGGSVQVEYEQVGVDDAVPNVIAIFKGQDADARAASERCAELLRGMSEYVVDDVWEDNDGWCVGVLSAQSMAEIDERVNSEQTAEDFRDFVQENLAGPATMGFDEQVQMLEGPIAVRIEEFPECVPNKATKVIVVGLRLEGRGWTGEPYWKGDFADLERAEYWALKREREYKTKGYRASASVYWQHDVTEEQVVKRVLEVMNSGK